MALPGLLSVSEFVLGTGGRIKATDPRVGVLIAGATAAVRRYCHWHVAPVIEQTFTMDGPGGDLLVLPTLHMSAVSALTVSGTDVDTSTLEWSENGEVRYPSGWPCNFRSIQITVTHGFDAADDLKQIIQQLVGNAIGSPLGATTESAGQVAVSWAQTAPGVSGGISLLARDLAVLDQYRLPKDA